MSCARAEVQVPSPLPATTTPASESTIAADTIRLPSTTTLEDAASTTTLEDSTAIHHSCSLAASKGPKSIAMPRIVQRLLSNPSSHSIPTTFQPDLSRTSLLVADSGATDHMIPDRSAFISYKRVHDLRVRMGNKTFAPVLGKGSALISLNGKKVLVRDCLHVPDLRNPLYSLRAHQRQRGCGFLGIHGHGVFVYFPHFVLEVDTTTDCHLRYQPLGRTCGLSEVDYVQPKRPTLIGAPTASDAATTPVTIPPDAIDTMPTYVNHNPKQPPRPSSPTNVIEIDDIQSNIKDFSVSLKDLSREELIEKLYTFEQPAQDTTVPTPKVLLSTMSKEEIAKHLHSSEDSMPPIRSCDTPNGSDTKTHWTGEELHRITGCRRLRNYRHLIHTSKDGQFVDGGEFPVSLGAYSTIPKARRGGPIDRTLNKFLDIVHMDIGFGDCMSIGGARYALILVDRATRYNWVFSLKSLSSSDIISALKSFRAEAGRLATEFRCDCDEKLFGSAIKSFLHDDNSKVVAAPAGRQSSNGLVESHWKIMVHMS